MRIMDYNTSIRCECVGHVSPFVTDLSKYDANKRVILPGTRSLVIDEP
jgi:hypothetical protein